MRYPNLLTLLNRGVGNFNRPISTISLTVSPNDSPIKCRLVQPNRLTFCRPIQTAGTHAHRRAGFNGAFSRSYLQTSTGTSLLTGQGMLMLIAGRLAIEFLLSFVHLKARGQRLLAGPPPLPNVRGKELLPRARIRQEKEDPFTHHVLLTLTHRVS